MHHRRLVYLFVPFLFALFAPPASALTIPILAPNIRSEASYGTLVSTIEPSFSSLPKTGFLQALSGANFGSGLVGWADSRMNYSLTTSAFHFDFDQDLASPMVGACGQPPCSNELSGPSSTYAIADFRFRPDASVDYALSGVFNGSYGSLGDPGSHGLQLTVSLFDQTTPAHYLFQSDQASNSTPGSESFTLGAHGGDFTDILSGSLTGTLLANHTYRLSLNATFTGSGSQTGDASHPSATGNLNFAFVPEPTTAALLGFGLTGLAAAGRKRQSAH